MSARDLGLLAVRVGVGSALFAHGAQKLLGWFGGHGPDGTGQFFDSIGFVPGKRSAIASGLAEAGGGALLATGLATGAAGAAVLGNMIVASSTHAPNGFFNTNGGFELPALNALIGAGLAHTGAGRYSLDAVTGDVLNKPWMRNVALVSAVASAVYLINARRQVLASRPAPAEES